MRSTTKGPRKNNLRIYFHASPKTAVLAAGVLCGVALIIWPGCATPRLAASRKPISSLRVADFTFLNGEHPTRLEVINRLGKPDVLLPEFRVSCYRVNRVTRRRLWLLFGVLPIAAPKDPDQVEFALIQYNDQEQAQRFTIRTLPDYPNSLRHAAREWVKMETKGRPQETNK